MWGCLAGFRRQQPAEEEEEELEPETPSRGVPPSKCRAEEGDGVEPPFLGLLRRSPGGGEPPPLLTGRALLDRSSCGWVPRPSPGTPGQGGTGGQPLRVTLAAAGGRWSQLVGQPFLPALARLPRAAAEGGMSRVPAGGRWVLLPPFAFPS